MPLAREDVPVPATYAEALAGLRDFDWCGSRNFQEQQLRANREGCHPLLLEFERLFVKRLAKLGIPMFAHEAVRSMEDQTAAFVRGVSKAKAGESPHNFGMAMDIVHGRFAWSLPKKGWDLIGHTGKELSAQRGFGVQWGGDWHFYDPAHWEIIGWRDLKGSFPFAAEWKP